MDSLLIKTLEEFFSKYTKIRYKKGETIIRAEDEPQGVFYLKKGYVRQYLDGHNGSMLMLHVFKPSSFFPMTWAINDTPNIYCYEAMETVEVWRAPRDAVREFLRKNPMVVYDLASRLLFGVTGILKRIEYLIMDSAYVKTVLLLLYLAEDLGVKDKEGILLTIPVTHREISAWIGTTRETASIQVETLKKRGLIKYRKRQLVIPSISLLGKETRRP